MRRWRPAPTPAMDRVRVLLVVLVVLAFAFDASAKVFSSQNQALREAFPESTRIERETHVLRGTEVEQIAALAGGDVRTKLVVIHTAYRGDEILGYAHIDVHTVRTQPEAFMVVLEPSGVVRSVRILAFHEPLDYLPTDRWYSQFAGKTRDDGLRVGRDVHGVVGATLSARAAAHGVRRTLAYWEVLLKSEGRRGDEAEASVQKPNADAAELPRRAEESRQGT